MVSLSCLLQLMGGIAGAAYMGQFGYHQWGWLGGVGGGVIGVPVGMLVAAMFCGMLDVLGETLGRAVERRRLRPHFGVYWKRARTAAWEQAKHDLSIGQTVTGNVVAQEYWGVFLDIGVGFPVQFARLYWNEAARSREPQLGDTISARVFECDDANRCIRLTQRWEATVRMHHLGEEHSSEGRSTPT